MLCKRITMQAIEQTLAFIVEIEKLKRVLRKTKPVGLDRYENSAEHSWHVCMTAMLLKDYSNQDIDINRVIRMLLIHDLGEIDAGDTIVYESQSAEVKAQELKGIQRLFDLLPNDKAEEFISLWQEFEAGETPDAAYAKAVDRVPPLLHNIYGDGHSWKKHKVPKEKVFDLNRKHISKGSQQLWDSIEEKLEHAVAAGILK